jgi:hypothetical protein
MQKIRYYTREGVSSMALGLDRKEIKIVYEKKYADHLKNRCKLPTGSFEGIYELKGFNTAQAEALADLAMKMMANKEAISEVILQNNLRIESQLKHLGVKID